LPSSFEAFAELGLTQTEGKVLECLINEGPTSGSEIAGRLGIHKSVAYFVLEQLVQKKLASFVVVNKKREYRPIDSETLKAKLEERKADFSKNFEDINTLLQAVRKKRKQTLFNIFEGWDGMKTAFNDIITTMSTKPDEEYIVFAVDPPEKVLPRFRSFIRRFHATRSSRSITCRLLVSSRLRSTIGEDRKRELHTSVRFVASEYSMPMAVNVYADKVLLAIWSDPPLAIILESKDVSESFKAFFRLLWQAGNP